MVVVAPELALKLQRALAAAGFALNETGLFDADTVVQLEAYLTSKGWTPPTSFDNAQKTFMAFVDAAGARVFDAAEVTTLAHAYLQARPAAGWLKKNWMWLAGGFVLLAGAGVGGFLWWKKSKAKKGAMGELGDGGLGCPCALGHGGRTSMYSFPSGRKRGHYRDSTGRFHAHP